MDNLETISTAELQVLTGTRHRLSGTGVTAVPVKLLPDGISLHELHLHKALSSGENFSIKNENPPNTSLLKGNRKLL